MDIITQKEFMSLVRSQDTECISMYIPIWRTGKETRQNNIRLKNMIRKAEDTFKGGPYSHQQTLLGPIKALIEKNKYICRDCKGLAIFSSENRFYKYCLPLSFNEPLVIADHFYVKPLLPLFTDTEKFYLLSIHQHSVRFYHGDRFQLEEVNVPDLPRHLDEVLKYDDPEKQMQFHTGTSQARSKRAAMFHGQGAGIEESKTNILRFFQAVDRAIVNYLQNNHIPLIVATIESLFPVYREANTYPDLEERFIDVHPNAESEHDLHNAAVALLMCRFEKKKKQAIDQYQILKEKGRTSDLLSDILRLSFEGRIESLLTDVSQSVWGTFDPNSLKVEIHENRQKHDTELLNRIVLETLGYGGNVIPLEGREMPEENKPAASILKG